jgi:hypothetical protein
MRALLLGLLAVAGCASTSTVWCPPLRAYDDAFEHRLADELEAAPAAAAWPAAILDYVTLRDQIGAACPAL